MLDTEREVLKYWFYQLRLQQEYEKYHDRNELIMNEMGDEIERSPQDYIIKIRKAAQIIHSSGRCCFCFQDGRK